MSKIIIASHNKHKIHELKLMLKDYFNEVLSLFDLGIDVDVEETGTTFLENATIKAKEIANLTSCSVIADDSGLCVDALNGAPGVYSARFAGSPCNDKNNNELLLKKLKDVKNRNAHYTSVLVLFNPKTNELIHAEGKVDGVILDHYQGDSGFGYDPLFYSNELKKTFAECTLDEKNTVSHRARALINLEKILKDKHIKIN